MLIREEALLHWLDNFYGYGSWHANIWFVDHEEGSGDLPQEVADKFEYFYAVHPPKQPVVLCDIRELFKRVSFSVPGPRAELFANLYEYRFGAHAVQHGGWKNLIAFVHGYDSGSQSGKKKPDLLSYQKNLLAQPSKKSEALLRLFPLPAHSHAWYYSWLDLPHLTFLQSRATYQDHVYESRMNYILQQMATHRPAVVVMYGMENINRLKKSVQLFYPDVKFTMVKAVGRQIPQHHRADLPGTTLLLTTQIPALRHNRIETGFDWEVFGKSLRR